MHLVSAQWACLVMFAGLGQVLLTSWRPLKKSVAFRSTFPFTDEDDETDSVTRVLEAGGFYPSKESQEKKLLEMLLRDIMHETLADFFARKYGRRVFTKLQPKGRDDFTLSTRNFAGPYVPEVAESKGHIDVNNEHVPVTIHKYGDSGYSYSWGSMDDGKIDYFTGNTQKGGSSSKLPVNSVNDNSEDNRTREDYNGAFSPHNPFRSSVPLTFTKNPYINRNPYNFLDNPYVSQNPFIPPGVFGSSSNSEFPNRGSSPTVSERFNDRFRTPAVDFDNQLDFPNNSPRSTLKLPDPSSYMGNPFSWMAGGMEYAKRRYDPMFNAPENLFRPNKPSIGHESYTPNYFYSSIPSDIYNTYMGPSSFETSRKRPTYFSAAREMRRNIH